MARVWDREDEEYLTCLYGNCQEDADDEFWMPGPHGDDHCYIFCTEQHLSAFCASHGLQRPELASERTARVLSEQQQKAAPVRAPRDRKPARRKEPIKAPSLLDYLTGRATLRQLIMGRW